MTTQPILLLDGHVGIHIPKHFVTNYGHLISNRNKGINVSLGDLGNPENEFYWESWDDILQNAILTYEGANYYLFQEDDLWAIPVGKNFEDFAE